MWLKPIAAVIALVGLLLELRGAYVTASMFQPFTFNNFLRHTPKLLYNSIIGFRPDKVLPPSYLVALEFKKELVTVHEAAYLFAGLGLLVVGIALQVIAGALMVWAEFRELSCHD